MTVRSCLAGAALVVLAAIALPGAARVATAQAPGQKQAFALIKVAELNALLKKGAKIPIIDVRSRQEFLTRHIKGAISIPLDTIEIRAGEVPRQGLVVLY